ncbi:MAG: HlyC/CorC family transporter [Chloroflexi bacterium]|nr:HlyC/CorC family transporter [Chloroflexota bacterium]
MDETELWVIYLLGLILALDLTLAAVRACVLRLSLKDLIRLREADKESFHRLLQILRRRDPLRLLVQLGMLLAHFLMAAGLLYLGLRTGRLSLAAPWELLATLLGVAVVIGAAEWLLDTALRGRPAAVRWAIPWAQRMTSLAAPFDRLISPHQESDWLLNDETLQALLQANLQEGRLEQEEREMLRSIVRFGDTLVREIMVPRIDMVTVEVNTPLPEATDLFIKTGFSRLPVFEEKIDNIVGLLYAKDLLPVWRAGLEEQRPLRSLLREAYFVPEAKKVDELLAEMQRRRMHMALVVDEYGGIAGLVTLEDIVEEIIGEIQDEYDLEEEPLDIRPLGPDEYLLSGRADIDDINEALGTEFPSDDADTLGGLLLSVTGHMPAEGEEIRLDGFLFTIRKVDQRRIVLVHARRLAAEVSADAAAA